ncbi:MAG: hypothetical protein M3384_10280 [Acidobacteriota bacterium]|nr:hypothetical protein [Acidobacteriota bacterium]
MKRIFLPALILLSAVAVFRAQSPAFPVMDFESGKPSELKGLTKLFVNAGTDAESRDQIVSEIERAKLPGLVFVKSREDAEIVMRFGGSEMEVLEEMTTTPVVGTDWTMTTVNRSVVQSGQGLVFIAGRERKRARIIMNFGSVQDAAFEKRPPIKFARAFVKAYKEANGLK